MRLMAVSLEARSLGLGVGLSLSDARARIPELAVFDHDPAADNRWLDRLAQGCIRYTPMVRADPPDGLTLDISGCAHLFGGEGRLARDLERRLIRLGMTVRTARAANAEAARAFARFGMADDDEDAAIRRLPVAALRLDEERERGLRRAGLKTIGALAQRPMASIAARFGETAVTALRRLLGEAQSPLDPLRSLPAIRIDRNFAEPIARTDYALQVLGELVAEAGEELEAREAGGRVFHAWFFRTDGLAQPLEIRTSTPTRDPAMVMRLFDEDLDRLSDPFDPGFGFDCVRLSIPVIESLNPAQLKFEGKAEQQARNTALIDRLSTRFGAARIRRFRLRDTHIPERVQIETPANENVATGQWPIAATGNPPMRPHHLFYPPQKIEVVAEIPDGPPHRFRWRGDFHKVAHVEGPERIVSEWWRRKDMAGLTRDYYRVEDSEGRRYWIFRHGLYGSERTNPDWYLHGLFA